MTEKSTKIAKTKNTIVLFSMPDAAIIRGRLEPDSIAHYDTYRSYAGLVDQGYKNNCHTLFWLPLAPD